LHDGGPQGEIDKKIEHLRTVNVRIARPRCLCRDVPHYKPVRARLDAPDWKQAQTAIPEAADSGSATRPFSALPDGNDPRVMPWEPAKFVAAIQQASTSGRPALMLVIMTTGITSRTSLPSRSGRPDTRTISPSPSVRENPNPEPAVRARGVLGCVRVALEGSPARTDQAHAALLMHRAVALVRLASRNQTDVE